MGLEFEEQIEDNWYERNAGFMSECKYSSEAEDAEYALSVVIPTFKREDGLIAAVESVLHQEDASFAYEVVIVDNWNDEEHIVRMVERLSALGSRNLRYLVNPTNIGLYGNWNMCIANAKAEVAALFHDDDILAPDYMKQMAPVLEFLAKQDDWGFVKTSYECFTDERNLPKLDPNRRNGLIRYTRRDAVLTLGLGTIGSPTCGALFHKSVVMREGGFPEKLYPSSDAIFAVKLAKNRHPVYITSVPVGWYRLEDNVSGKADTMVATLQRDRELVNWISSFGVGGRLYAHLFGTARIESIRRLFHGRLVSEGKESPKELAEPACGKLRFLLYRLCYGVNKVLRIGFRVQL